MTSLTERIRLGEAAIARAKARGRDVSHWEQHLERLKRDALENTDATEGRIIAVEICSEVLQAHVWFTFDGEFNPGDDQAVFYAHELKLLKTKTPEKLREIHKLKLAFGPGSRVRQ